MKKWLMILILINFIVVGCSKEEKSHSSAVYGREDIGKTTGVISDGDKTHSEAIEIDRDSTVEEVEEVITDKEKETDLSKDITTTEITKNGSDESGEEQKENDTESSKKNEQVADLLVESPKIIREQFEFLIKKDIESSMALMSKDARTTSHEKLLSDLMDLKVKSEETNQTITQMFDTTNAELEFVSLNHEGEKAIVVYSLVNQQTGFALVHFTYEYYFEVEEGLWRISHISLKSVKLVKE